MTARLLADLLLVIHAAFVAFVVLGGLLVLRWRWIAPVHLLAAAWGVFVEATGRVCPLTPLENALRAQAGDAGYEGGFIDHYVLPVLYPAGLTREVQGVLAVALVAANVAIYAWVLRSTRKKATQ